MKLRVLVGLLICSGALAQSSTSFTPPHSPAPTTLQAPPTPQPDATGSPVMPTPAVPAVLAAPRLSSANGSTRVVLDLPDHSEYTVTRAPGGLRIDVQGVAARSQHAVNATQELKSWSVTPTSSGATVTLLTAFPLGPQEGWLSFELPAEPGRWRRLVVDLNASLTGTVPVTPAAVHPTATAAPAPTALPSLTVPRFGMSPGQSRVVLEFGDGVQYAINPGPLGLRVDLTGVTAPAQAGLHVSPELAEWRYEPTTTGVSVTLRTSYALSARGGWKSILLPPAPGGTLNRLAIDLAPALADTSPLNPHEAALPPFPAPVRVVLDPGHGGRDPGAVASVVEKIVTLDVALRVRRLLETAGAQVTLTRDRDEPLSPDKSTDLAMRAALGHSPNQLYVSIHVNAMDKHAELRGYGVETWWYPNDAGSQRLAAHLQAQVVRFSGAYSQGLKSTSLAVLRQAKVPAALVEIGYTTHPVDGQNLLSTHYLDRVAAGIAWGIRDYLDPPE